MRKEITVISGTYQGVRGRLISVEIRRKSSTYPEMNLQGLSKQATKETLVRSRSAIKNTGYIKEAYHPYSQCVTISAEPLDLPKDPTAFDLPVAIALLAEHLGLSEDTLQSTLFVGELSLAGEILSVRGIVPIAREAVHQGIRCICASLENAEQVRSMVPGIEVRAAQSLGQLIDSLQTGKSEEDYALLRPASPRPSYTPCISEIKGHKREKRVLEIAAAGRHNLLMIGPGGSGQTMLARRLATIAAPLSQTEREEAQAIYSISRINIPDPKFQDLVPFRTPHHTISDAGIQGGGNPAYPARPGEVSLAHGGILYLDELPEFRIYNQELIGDIAKAGIVTRSRGDNVSEYPARFQLVGSMNPCACYSQRCQCSVEVRRSYRNRLRLRRHFDMCIQVKPPTASQSKGEQDPSAETSQTVRERVIRAVEHQYKRSCSIDHEGVFNAYLSLETVTGRFPLADDAHDALDDQSSKLCMSEHEVAATIRVARTIADLRGADRLGPEDIIEAVEYTTFRLK